PLVVLVIGMEIVLAVYKMIQKQWTYKLATFFTISQLASIIILVIILTQANIFTPEFLIRTSELFTTTPVLIENSIVWGAIMITVVFAAWGIFDVYKRANIKIDMKKVNDQ